MEKEQRKRTEMIPYLQDTMEEILRRTCGEIQTVLDTDVCRIWRGFREAVCECLETAGVLQRQGQKGRLKYLAQTGVRRILLRPAVFHDRIPDRADPRDRGGERG